MILFVMTVGRFIWVAVALHAQALTYLVGLPVAALVGTLLVGTDFAVQYWERGCILAIATRIRPKRSQYVAGILALLICLALIFTGGILGGWLATAPNQHL